MSYSVVFPADKVEDRLSVPVVCGDIFLVANFTQDRDVVMHGKPQTQIMYRSHEVGGSAVIAITVNGSKHCNNTKTGFDVLKVMGRGDYNVAHNMFSLRPDEFPADVCYDLSTQVITYTEKRRVKEYVERYIIKDTSKFKTWKVHLAEGIVMEMSEERLSQLEWFAIMQAHQCIESRECTLRLETYDLKMFTCLMRFVEVGILKVPYDASLDTLLEMYRTFEFFNVISACEYMAEIMLCKDNVSNATIEALLPHINLHDILRRRFVMLMQWRFTKTVADMIRPQAHDLPVLIADLFHLIPYKQNAFEKHASSEPPRHIIVQFDSEDGVPNMTTTIQPQVRDESDSSGLGSQTESEDEWGNESEDLD